MKNRFPQILLIVTCIGFSWLMMQVFHEMGHVIGAVLTGATVEKVILYPTTFGRTAIESCDHKLLVIWAGPVLGVIEPLLLYAVLKPIKTISVFFRFLASFCCMANGAYIGFGPNAMGLDTELMIKYGSHRWQLLAFGVPVLIFGIWLLKGTGKDFGIGKRDGKVNPKLVMFSVVSFITVVAVELILNLSS